MDERCQAAHAKLLAGTCPWCGRAIFNGRVLDKQPELLAVLERIGDARVSFESVELGTSLKKVVERDGALDWVRAAYYIEQVVRQLAEVHSTEPFHGGVRPGNIYLDEGGCAHLVLSVDSVIHTTVDESAIPDMVDCIAPELAVNGPKADCRADIYGLGCALYFLLAGRPPFPNGSIAEKLLQHQVAHPEPLISLRPDLPDGLIRICEKMMAKKPEERYTTAIEVAAALAGLHA
jgi:serine/threonine-protein kinase